MGPITMQVRYRDLSQRQPAGLDSVDPNAEDPAAPVPRTSLPGSDHSALRAVLPFVREGSALQMVLTTCCRGSA
jgi:hypothetical protein